MLCWVVNADGSQIPFPSVRTYVLRSTDKKRTMDGMVGMGYVLRLPHCRALVSSNAVLQYVSMVLVLYKVWQWGVYVVRIQNVEYRIQPQFPLNTDGRVCKYRVHNAECMHVWWVVRLIAWKWSWVGNETVEQDWIEVQGYLTWPATELIAN